VNITPRVAILGAAIVVVAGVAAVLIATSNTPRNPVATFQVVDETYKIELATTELVAHAEALLAGENVAAIPNGIVVRNDPGPNAPWSWHIDPATLHFADMTIEVCDGLPSYVEDEIVTSDQYCPWSAQIIAIDGLPDGPVTAAARAAVVPAEDTCTELSDVGTLVNNWRFAQSQGRLIENEYNGGMRLAARMLARVPVEPGTPLADAVADLQALAPATPPGGIGTGVDPENVEWYAAFSAVADACNAALGATDVLDGFATEGWVGG